MRKLFLTIAFVLLMLVTLLPGAVGWLVSRQHAELAADLDRRWRGARVTVADFQPGWFRSQLSLAIRTGRHRLRLDTRLQHGPFAPRPGWLFAHGPVANDGGREIGRLTARLTLAGRIDAQLEMLEPPLQPGTLTTRISGLGQLVEISLHDAQHAQFSDLDVHGTIDLASGRGSFALTASRLSDPSIALFGSHWQLDYQTQEGMLTVDQSLTAERLRLTGMNRDFGSSRLRVRLEHLHQPTLASVASSGADALPLLLPLLLNHRPKLVVEELSLSHPDGSASLDATLAMLTSPPGGWLSSPALLSRAARGTGQARISPLLLEDLLRVGYAGLGYSEAQLADAIAAQVSRYQRQGLLVREDADWVSRWNLDQGVLTLNGERRVLAEVPSSRLGQTAGAEPALVTRSPIPAGESASHSAPASSSSWRLP